MTKISTIAAFDFDGTITYRDTLFPFLVFATGIPLTTVKVITELPSLINYGMERCSRQELKEKFIWRFFGNRPLEELMEIGKEYAQGPLSKKIKPKALEKLRWHQEQGHRCILVSAALDVYLKPWAELMGFDDLICSEVGINGRGLISGELNGLNCWGPEKARRLEQMLRPRSDYILYAYGDSLGDEEMLQLADRPFYRTF